MGCNLYELYIRCLTFIAVSVYHTFTRVFLTINYKPLVYEQNAEII